MILEPSIKEITARVRFFPEKIIESLKLLSRLSSLKTIKILGYFDAPKPDAEAYLVGWIRTIRCGDLRRRLFTVIARFESLQDIKIEPKPTEGGASGQRLVLEEEFQNLIHLSTIESLIRVSVADLG